MLKDENKKLVCFGAGKMLHNFINIYERFGFVENIAFILDNDKGKYNTQLELYNRNKKIDIISVQKFCTCERINDFVVLISCADVVSVYEQLQNIEALRDVECCILSFVRGMTNEIDEENRYYPSNFRIYDVPKIPKVIHYCWFGGKEIPEQNKVWMESWKKYCPDFEIVEWNENNYDITKNAYMFEAYQAKEWGFVPDYARLDIIYHYGGIYLDTDVELIKNLDELLYQDAFVGVDGSKNISLGLGFGAVPQFNLMKELMDEYNVRSFGSVNKAVNKTAAPTLQIPFFKNIGYLNNGEYQRIANLTIYPEKVLSGKCCYTGRIGPTKNTFSIHHYDGSWNSEEKKVQIKRINELYQTLEKMNIHTFQDRKNI